MGAYLRLLGSLVQNLVRRVGEDLADCAVVCRRGVVYKLRNIRLRYDDVGPSSELAPHWQPQPQQLAALVESVRTKPWFCDLDRKTAQDLVHDGGPGCFLVRPSASTKSLTLTLWHRHRAYNILVRQREDGLLALGNWKSQEMTFYSVEEMVRYYEREPLILYSGGELAGTTRLKAPPPGLVRSPTTRSLEMRRSSSTTIGRRPPEDIHRPVNPSGLRTLSFGNAGTPFNGQIQSSDNNISLLRNVRSLSSENFNGSLNRPRNQFSDKIHKPSAFAGPQQFSTETSKECSISCENTLSENVQRVFIVNEFQPTSTENICDCAFESKLPKEDQSLSFLDSGMQIYLSSSKSAGSQLSFPITNRRAVSTPNIDIPEISDRHRRRLSCDNLNMRTTPLILTPRPPSSFKETQKGFGRAYQSVKKEQSTSVYNNVSTLTCSSLPAVHPKVAVFSLCKTNSHLHDCSC